MKTSKLIRVVDTKMKMKLSRKEGNTRKLMIMIWTLKVRRLMKRSEWLSIKRKG